MSTFNPYSHWLGFTAKEKPETYYELLGLAHGEKNLVKIAKVVEETAAKVQKMGPEGHFPEWNQILTEIQVAKNCLCNPKYKADYDAKHPAPSAPSAPQTPAAGMAAPLDPAAQAQSVLPAAPVQQDPQAQVQPQPGMYPGMQPGMQPGMMGMQPGMYPGMQPGMMGMQPGMYPGMMGMQPGMQNMYGGVAYPQPGMMPQQPAVMQPQPAVMQPQPAVMPQQPAVMQPQPAVMPQPPAQPQPAPAANPLEGAELFAASSSASFSPKPVAVKSASKSSKSSAKKASSGPTPMQRNIIAIVGLLIVAVLAFMLMNKRKVVEIAPQEDGTVAININNPLENAAPAAAPASVEAAPVDPAAQPVQEVVAENSVPAATGDLQVPDFDAINRLITARDFNGANTLLKKAAKMNVSPENAKRVERLDLINTQAENFYNNICLALNEAKEKFPAELCNGMCSLVEFDGTKATLHIEGKNVHFTMDEPQRKGYNLYEILYQDRMAGNVKNGNMKPAIAYATFEMVHPNGNKEKAQELFASVVEKGTEDDRKVVAMIQEEFGVNGLGEATNQAIKAEEDAQTAAKLEEEKAKGKDVAQLEEEKTPATDEKAGTSEASGEETAEGDGKVAKSKKKGKKSSKAEEAEAKALAEAEADKKKKEEEEALAKERHENEWKQVVTSIRQDLAWQRMTQAKRSLGQLEKIAKSDEEKAEHYRLQTIADYLDLFVKGVGNQLGTFTPASTINVNGKDLGVVESVPGRLVIREEGVNKTYTTENLNPKLVEFLVGKHLKEADDYILYGTYLAMDVEGDRAKAKTYWSTAQTKDASKKDTVEVLMAELDVPLVDAGKRPSSNTPVARNGKQIEQRTVPIGADHDKAFEELKKEYAKDYEKDDPQNKRKLAEKFIKQAQLPKTPSAQAYVMAEEATRIGKENSFFEIACQGLMIHEMIYQRDTYQERFDFLKKANPEARGSSSASDFANCALAMGFDAVQRGKKIDANQMLNLAREHVKGSQVKKMKQLEMMINQMK